MWPLQFGNTKIKSVEISVKLMVFWVSLTLSFLSSRAASLHIGCQTSEPAHTYKHTFNLLLTYLPCADHQFYGIVWRVEQHPSSAPTWINTNMGGQEDDCPGCVSGLFWSPLPDKQDGYTNNKLWGAMFGHSVQTDVHAQLDWFIYLPGFSTGFILFKVGVVCISLRGGWGLQSTRQRQLQQTWSPSCQFTL